MTSPAGTRVARIAGMARISTSGVWVLCALFVLAAAAAGLGCVEYSCETCNAQLVPEAQSATHYQPARTVASAAVLMSSGRIIVPGAGPTVFSPNTFDGVFVPGDITLRI